MMSLDTVFSQPPSQSVQVRRNVPSLMDVLGKELASRQYLQRMKLKYGQEPIMGKPQAPRGLPQGGVGPRRDLY